MGSRLKTMKLVMMSLARQLQFIDDDTLFMIVSFFHVSTPLKNAFVDVPANDQYNWFGDSDLK